MYACISAFIVVLALAITCHATAQEASALSRGE